MTVAATPSERPTALPVLGDCVPTGLTERDHWVVWLFEWRPSGWTKAPYRADGRGRASTTDPLTWSTFTAAMAAYRDGQYDGIGIVLNHPLIGIDHDHAVNPITGELSEQARAWKRLGAYRELSPSGTGVHDLVTGELPDDPDRHGQGRRKGTLEVYAGGRFLTVTAHRLQGSAADIPVADGALVDLYHQWLPNVPRSAPLSSPPSPLDRDDASVLHQVRSAKNGYKFAALWAGDTSAHGGDDSAADLALVSHLTFFTQDAGQIDRLFRASGLMRPKWDRPDYRERTIARAMQRSEFYQPPGRVLTMPGNRADATRVHPDSGESVSRETGEILPVPSNPAPGSTAKKSQATQAVELALASRITLWHTPPGDAQVTLAVNEHFEHHPVGSKSFKEWLARRYWLAEGKSIGNQALQDAINTLSGQARFEGAEHALANRIAHLDGAVWVDIGGPDWSAVRIDRDGYRVVTSPEVPVKFKRTRSILPLPLPVPGGSLDELRALFQFDDDNWLLVVGCLIGVFQADGGRAHLELVGRQGSGKSTFARFFVGLVDPSEVPARSLPKDEDALVIGVQGRSVLVLDNVSSLTAEMSDAFCRVSTGGGLGRRQLYSDSDEVLLRVQLPLVWTGISPVTINRPDLADRTVSVTIEPLDETQYRSERSLVAEFEAMRPRLFGALCDAVSSALANRDAVRLDRLPRLADFALWVESAAVGLGWEHGAFSEALGASRTTANALAVDASPIGPLVVRFAQERQSWEGSASDLLDTLRSMVTDDAKRARGFPRQPNHLSNALRRIQPALASAGVFVGFDRGRSGSIIRIDRQQLGLRPTADEVSF